jgi:hypothetical protein
MINEREKKPVPETIMVWRSVRKKVPQRTGPIIGTIELPSKIQRNHKKIIKS